jgi:hypothetical protein
MTHYVLATIGYVLVVVSAAAAALTCTIAAATASVPLSVSATVVRSCKVDSTGSSGSVRLACSTNATPVMVSGATGSDVLTLPAASLPANSRTAARTDRSTHLVTLNF